MLRGKTYIFHIDTAVKRDAPTRIASRGLVPLSDYSEVLIVRTRRQHAHADKPTMAAMNLCAAIHLGSSRWTHDGPNPRN